MFWQETGSPAMAGTTSLIAVTPFFYLAFATPERFLFILGSAAMSFCANRHRLMLHLLNSLYRLGLSPGHNPGLLPVVNVG